MKGYVFTLTTFIIFMGIIAYYTAFTDAAGGRSTLVNEQLSGERIFHTWRSIASAISVVTNTSVAKTYDIDEINDTLPASKDIPLLLSKWQTFVGSYYNDPGMTAAFVDGMGNTVDLKDSATMIRIMPMGINYTWSDWHKEEMTIKENPDTFPFIERITLNVLVRPNISNTNFVWTPAQNCNVGTTHCLNLTLHFYDDNGVTWTDIEQKLDADQQSHFKAESGGGYWVRVEVGRLPDLLHIYLKDTNVTLNTRFDLNTTEFYNSFMAKLRVSSPYGQKLAPVSGLSVWTSQK